MERVGFPFSSSLSIHFCIRFLPLHLLFSYQSFLFTLLTSGLPSLPIFPLYMLPLSLSPCLLILRSIIVYPFSSSLPIFTYLTTSASCNLPHLSHSSTFLHHFHSPFRPSCLSPSFFHFPCSFGPHLLIMPCLPAFHLHLLSLTVCLWPYLCTVKLLLSLHTSLLYSPTPSLPLSLTHSLIHSLALFRIQ